MRVSCLYPKPVRKIYRDLIEQEWPNIQRIMASLAQKDVTQATIVRKLASWGRAGEDTVGETLLNNFGK